jgi:hypothetical protein
MSKWITSTLPATRARGNIWGDLVHDGSLMHAHKGETAPARDWLEAALAIFRRLGARKDVERTAQAKADLPCP